MQILRDIVTSLTFWVAVGSVGAFGAFVIAMMSYIRPEKRLNRSLAKSMTLESIDLSVSVLIRHRIRKQFKGYKDHVTLRYGSSIELGAKHPMDFDYMVLLLGYAEENTKVQYQHGDAFDLEKIGKYVDIQYKDYNSFIFALVSGMPYEHGVINNCYFMEGNEGYLSWLKKIQQNVEIDRDYAIQKLLEQCKEYNKIIEDELALGNCEYSTIIALYSLASCVVQIDCYRSFPKKCSYKYILPLTKTENLINFLPAGQFKDAFTEIVKYFKREYAKPQSLEANIRQYKDQIAPFIIEVLNEK